MCGFVNRIAVDSAAYRRKRDALQAFPAGQFQAVLISRRKQPGLILRAAAVDGSYGMNNITRLEVATGCHDSFAGRASSDLTAFLHNCRSAGPVDGAVHTGPPG